MEEGEVSEQKLIQLVSLRQNKIISDENPSFL
jgi:hypothetical protein